MSTSTRRALRILEALKGKTLQGLSNAELARGLGESAVNVSRALAVLEEAGWVTHLDTGRWAHSIKLLQIAVAHADELAKAEQQLGELRQRVLAGAR